MSLRPIAIAICLWSATIAAGRTDEPPKLASLPVKVPAPPENPITEAKAALGRRLFFDPRLSGDNTISCATCHTPERAFADGKRFSTGVNGELLTRNTPGLLNVAFQSAYFWDGRAETLEEQALAPIVNPQEMNQDLDELERELEADAEYARQFRDVFGEGVTREGIARALACYQRTLVTGPSRVDRYLAGEKSALSDDEIRGMELFVGDAGCIRCHHGPLLSDGRYYRLGVSFRDDGRSRATGKPEDRFKFRTPGLRNVSKTAPYMHDGSMGTLQEVVTFYLRSAPISGPDNLPVDIRPIPEVSLNDVELIVAFLKALDGTEN